MLREERWRHQENGYLIALSSFVPTNLLTLSARADATDNSVALEAAHDADGADAAADVAAAAGPNVDMATAASPKAQSGPETMSETSPEPNLDSKPESEPGSATHRDVDVYSDLIRHHGPVAFTTSVSARMPTVRERDALEIEVGVSLLILTRVMLDAHGHPLEATVIHAPADCFDAAHSSRRPILSL